MITAVFIFITALISVLCFNNKKLFAKLSLDPYKVVHGKQWYRIITHGFVHANYTHLIINLIVMWSFGTAVDNLFSALVLAGTISSKISWYLALYFGSLIFSSLYDVFWFRNNPYYVSVGASGAVSALVFTTIFLRPLDSIAILGILPLPSILFGVLYLAYEFFAARKNDGINHYAHIFGAFFGFVFPLFMSLSTFNIFLGSFL